MSTTSFSLLPLAADVLANLDTLGYKHMTPIQAKCLPHILESRDVIGQAKTGSGKTAAFGLGLLAKIEVEDFRIQALVLCPTRELADQVSKELRLLARFTHNVKILTLCGGQPLSSQLLSLERGAHIIVGTPGRIEDLLGRRSLHLSKLKILVLDEADRMLDMGFSESISYIISRAPQNRQTLLFSATYPDTIKSMSLSVQKNPISVKVDATHSEADIEQVFYQVRDEEQKIGALLKLLSHYECESTVVFCNTKIQCQNVAEALQKNAIKALPIHGDLEQREREEALVLFSNKSYKVLVATDVAARGLDIKDLHAVVNFELSRNPEVHVHRIGRTGRAGNKGLALSLFTPRETRKVEQIETYQNKSFACKDIAAIAPKHFASVEPIMVTLKIGAGRKNKIRKGDILGALTGEAGQLLASQVGKIDIFDFHSCVAIDAKVAQQALVNIEQGKIKGRTVKVREL